MRIDRQLLVLVFVVAGCSSASPTSPGPSASSTPSPAASTSAPAASPSVVPSPSPLEGRWATGPVLIDDITAAMIAAGISPEDAAAWVIEVGSPTQYSFELNFTETRFTHSEETPDMAMEVGETGTFALSGAELVVTTGQSGNVDTYTFEATIARDQLSLRWVDSTEQGTADDKEHHHRYTVAFYCSAPFIRQP